MAVASGGAKGAVVAPPKKTNWRMLLTMSLSGVLGVDSLNFTMMVYLCNLSQPIRSS